MTRKKTTLMVFVVLCVAALFSMGHDTVSRYSFDSIVFSDGTFAHHNQCSEFIGFSKTPAGLKHVTNTTTSGVTRVVDADIYNSDLFQSSLSEWSRTSGYAEYCFDPADDVSGDFLCEMHATALHTTNLLFMALLGSGASGSLATTFQITNWVQKAAVSKTTNFSYKQYFRVDDSKCVGMVVDPFVDTGAFWLYDYSLSCRQVSTAAYPCHQ